MSYTVGIKRKLWFGYRKVMVTGHDWQNGRFILNLSDGSQEHIPGYAAPSLKVYADFWNHLAQIERSRPPRAEPPRHEAEPVPSPQPHFERQGAVAQEPVKVIPEDPLMQEARRRAAQRIASIAGGYGADEGLAPRPPFS